MATKNILSVFKRFEIHYKTVEEFAKKAEEKYTRRKTAKKKTQLRKQQRKHKREKYCA